MDPIYPPPHPFILGVHFESCIGSWMKGGGLWRSLGFNTGIPQVRFSHIAPKPAETVPTVPHLNWLSFSLLVSDPCGWGSIYKPRNYGHLLSVPLLPLQSLFSLLPLTDISPTTLATMRGFISFVLLSLSAFHVSSALAGRRGLNARSPPDVAIVRRQRHVNHHLIQSNKPHRAGIYQPVVFAVSFSPAVVMYCWCKHVLSV